MKLVTLKSMIRQSQNREKKHGVGGSPAILTMRPWGLAHSHEDARAHPSLNLNQAEPILYVKISLFYERSIMFRGVDSERRSGSINDQVPIQGTTHSVLTLFCCLYFCEIPLKVSSCRS